MKKLGRLMLLLLLGLLLCSAAPDNTAAEASVLSRQGQGEWVVEFTTLDSSVEAFFPVPQGSEPTLHCTSQVQGGTVALWREYYGPNGRVCSAADATSMKLVLSGQDTGVGQVRIHWEA